MSGTVLRPRTNLKFAVAVCCAAVLLISACSGLQLGRWSPSSQKSNSLLNCRALARQGVTTCPPENPKFGSPRLVNHSRGLASPAESKRYAKGLLKNLAYEQFALNTSQASILRLGLLATPHATNLIYSADLASIALAKNDNARLTSSVPVPSTIKLVRLPAIVQGYIRDDGYGATPLAWVVIGNGPSLLFTTRGSSFRLLGSTSSVASYLYWGTYRSSSKLGPIWTFDGSTPCDSDPVWQSVCNE